MSYNPSDQSRMFALKLLRSLGMMISGGVVVVAVLIVVGVWRSGDRFFQDVTKFLTVTQAEPKVEPRSAVVKQIREASELTTAVFTMESVVPAQQDATLGGFVVGTTKLLYIARGEVRAGVDLSALTPDAIEVVGEKLRLRLPPPRLLDSKIDISRSSVYDYNRGMLGLGPDVAPALQALAQQEALKKIKTAACADGILQKASDRAKLVVTQLVRIPGYQEISVEIAPPSPVACQ
jgi:predicted transcriptional regulator